MGSMKLKNNESNNILIIEHNKRDLESDWIVNVVDNICVFKLFKVQNSKSILCKNIYDEDYNMMWIRSRSTTERLLILSSKQFRNGVAAQTCSESFLNRTWAYRLRKPLTTRDFRKKSFWIDNEWRCWILKCISFFFRIFSKIMFIIKFNLYVIFKNSIIFLSIIIWTFIIINSYEIIVRIFLSVTIINSLMQLRF